VDVGGCGALLYCVSGIISMSADGSSGLHVDASDS